MKLPTRRWFRFGLRLFLLGITGIWVLLATEVNRARRHERATRIIVKEGASIIFTRRLSEGRRDQSNWTCRKSGDRGPSLIQHLLLRPWRRHAGSHIRQALSQPHGRTHSAMCTIARVDEPLWALELALHHERFLNAIKIKAIKIKLNALNLPLVWLMSTS